MAKFCKKCGTALNSETGLCPNCVSDDPQIKGSEEIEASEPVTQEISENPEIEVPTMEAEEKPEVFRGFCMVCGTTLDSKTGLCPVCGKEEKAEKQKDKKSKKDKSSKSKKSKSKAKGKDKEKDGGLPAVAAVILAVFLSLLVFAFTLVPTLILSVRSATTEPALREIISEVDMVTVLSAIPVNESESITEYDNLYDNLCYNLEVGFDVKVTDNRMREFFSDEGVVEDVAELLNCYAEDVWSGTEYFTFTPEDLADIFYSNSSAFEEAFDTYLTRDEYQLLASYVISETPEIYPSTLQKEYPVAMSAVQYGASYVSIIAMYVLATGFALLAVLLCKARRGFIGVGVSIGLVGLITSLAAFVSGAIPALWKTICAGNDAIASVSAQVINYNLLIYLITLGVGFILFVIGMVLCIKNASNKVRNTVDSPEN